MAHYRSIGHVLFAGNGTVIVGALLCGGVAHAQNIALTPAPVEVQIHDVNLRLDRSTVLEIKTLRGQLVPIRRDVPVTFDDVNSFTTRITTAEIGISLRTLSDLLNQHVFAYPGAPLKNIALTADRGRIKQVGTIHKGIDIPFEIEGTLEATQSGSLRFHADKIFSGHIPVKGLLHFFGEDLSKLVNLKGDRGVTVDGDNIMLYPDRLLPPPRIEGKITAGRIQGDRIVLAFDSGTTKPLSPPYKISSYLYHRGGVLRFGKLTMNDTDLEIVSESQHSPFEFSLPEYNRQLTAGYSKNTPSHGLIAFMGDLTSPSAQGAAPPRRDSGGWNRSLRLK